VGGGPAGLLSAIMMAQHPPPNELTLDDDISSWEIQRIVVYDKLPPVPPPDDLVYSTDISKYYLLGLGHRGQQALRHFDVWDDVEKSSVAVVGRRDWATGKSNEEDGTVILSDIKSVPSRVLARDKLVGVLQKVIEERYSDVIELKFGWQVDPISFGNEEMEEVLQNYTGVEGRSSGPPVKLQISQCNPAGEANECSIDDNASRQSTTITADFLIGADGAARTIANAMEANCNGKQQHQRSNNPLLRPFQQQRQLPFKVTRYDDDNPRVYKSIPIKFPSHWPHNLNYSARSTNNRVVFEALPSDANGNYCALMLLKPYDELAAANCKPAVLRSFYDEEYPQFSALLDDAVIEDVAKKGASSLPSFRFAGPRLHEGGRTVLLGDSIHTVKPYFGLGANTALEDVEVLSDILSVTPDLSEAVEMFTKNRSADSKALVTISRGMDRPGKLGTMRFIIPLIVDSIFNKVAPTIFAPGIFGMFQKQGIQFDQIQKRKRLDRLTQSFVILSAMSVMGVGIRYIVKLVVRAIGIKNSIMSGSMGALLASAVGLARRNDKPMDVDGISHNVSRGE